MVKTISLLNSTYVVNCNAMQEKCVVSSDDGVKYLGDGSVWYDFA